MVKIIFKCDACKSPFRSGCKLDWDFLEDIWDFLEDIIPVCMPAPDTCPYHLTKQNWVRRK
jgi:hypothetical protein